MSKHNRPKSTPTFLRNAIKIKGSTTHSGRGWYDLAYNCTAEDLQQRLNKLAIDFASSVESMTNSEDVFEIIFKPKTKLSIDDYYRRVAFIKQGNELVVSFTGGR